MTPVPPPWGTYGNAFQGCQANHLGHFPGAGRTHHHVGQTVESLLGAKCPERIERVRRVAVQIIGVGQDVLVADDLGQRFKYGAIQHGPPSGRLSVQGLRD